MSLFTAIKHADLGKLSNNDTFCYIIVDGAIMHCLHNYGREARCGLVASVKACCVILYLCLAVGRQAAGKQEDTPSCYQETKAVFR